MKILRAATVAALLVCLLASGASATEADHEHSEDEGLIEHGAEGLEHGEEEHEAHAHGEEGHDHAEHYGHDHGSAFEWGGVFETSEESYVWIAQAVEGSYADPAMKMVALPASAATKLELQALEEEALQALESPCADVVSGGVITPGSTCYNLLFNTSHIGGDGLFLEQNPARMCSDLDTNFIVNATGAAHIAFFTEHMPTEFERSQHYLKNAAGEDIEPAAELMKSPPKPWGVAIGAAIIINLVTLVGVVFSIPILSSLVKRFPATFGVGSSAFAAGAILAAAFFLLLYEATHLIPINEERTEADAAAAWGSMVLLGFLTAPIIDLIVLAVLTAIFGKGQPNGGDDASKDQASAAEAGAKAMKSDLGPLPSDILSVDEASIARSRRTVCGVVIGDFFHNFADGLFIGTAFRFCGPTLGWTVTLATVYHEIAQEVSDYCILTDDKQGALRPWVALLLNFLSGTSVILGVIVVLAAELDNFATGMLLAFSGGIYVHIACECTARVYPDLKTLGHRVVHLGLFIIGALGIGLVLLDHEHCTAGGGHDHGH